MNEDVKAELNKKEPSAFHDAMLTHVRSLVKMSRSKMSEYYPLWDLHDKVYRGEIVPDKDDLRQELKGKPTKMIVPNTFAQCMTWTSFQFLMFNQNTKFYELVPNGDEDHGLKHQDSEKILERDLRRNSWNTKLFQNLLDTARFGTGVLEVQWTEQYVSALLPQEAPLPGVELPPVWQRMLKYEGNEIKNVSVYRFFPDTRHPLVDFQKGEFCASEEDFSMAQLRAMEAAGEVAGVSEIGPLVNKERGSDTRSSAAMPEVAKKFDAQNESHTAIVTKVQIWIIPSKFKIEGEKTLGEEDFPILYHVWYANDNRVIRCEPAQWWHNEFSWCVTQFTPDMQHTLTMGLADLVNYLQDVISWLINSHITSVRRVIGNRMLVNPAVVDTKTLDGEGDIYMRKGMNVPFERALKQLDVRDVTGGHMADSEMLGRIMETITGVNGNAMGQYNSGRRSAQEARVVTAGAAGRMKMHGHLLWESGYGRMGRLMLSNLRQNLSEASFKRIIGQGRMNPQTGQAPEQDIAERYAAFQGTPEDVICGDDYFMFDSTLASEKGFMAQSLQELLGIILSNPMASAQFDISPKALLEEIQRLRGAGNISRFSVAQRVATGQEAPPQPPQVMPV